jgi:hypothetical protein
MEESYNLDLNRITGGAFIALDRTDKALIGTPDYMGIAYFWAMGYKHEMRAADSATRRAVHSAFLEAGLDIAGESPAHAQAVKRLTKHVKPFG